MVTRTPSGIVRVWRVETAENLADDDKYCLLTLFREWLWVCNFHKCHHPSLGTAQRGQQTHTAKKLLSPKMKIVLNFRLADPIQAQRLYEAQRDLRPLHRQQEADTQQKVRTEDTVMGDINLRDNGGLSSVRLFCFRLAASTFVTHLHNGENRETHRDHIEKHI